MTVPESQHDLSVENLAPFADPDPLPQEVFVDAYAVFVRQRVPEIVVARVERGVRLTWPDAAAVDQSLVNAYTDYRREAGTIAYLFEKELAAAISSRPPPGP